ncbi:VWA domain-containing protein, partial [Planctomycetota bacterium]
MKSTLMMMMFVACWASVSTAAQNVVVLLDDSGSMQERMHGQPTSRIDAAKDALLTVLNQIPDDGSIGVLAMNGTSGGGEWIIELGPIDKSQIENAVGRIQARGGTPLGAFMKQAADALLQLREKQFYGTYRLLVVTDGEANDAAFLDSVLPDVLRRNITVDVIGVDMKTDHSLATQVDNYRRADDPESL